MERRGLSLHEIARRLVGTEPDNGFVRINESGGKNGVALPFPAGEVIRYDGTDWHHIGL